MLWLRQLALVSALLMSPAWMWAQSAESVQPQSQPQAEKKEPKSEQNEPALPPAPSETLREEIKKGMEAQPPCRADVYPCVIGAREKFQMFVDRTYSPFTLASAAFDAAYSQISGDSYGPGVRGAAKRYGANLADGEARSFFQTFLYSTIFQQDPRYHRIEHGNVIYRASYAASRVLIGRTDTGTSSINMPELLGVATSASLSNLYYPDRDRGTGRTLNRALGALASDALSNVMREFWPDVRRILRRHEPEAIQKIEEKVTGIAAPITGRPSGQSDKDQR
jgi:hypothetical protein